MRLYVNHRKFDLREHVQQRGDSVVPKIAEIKFRKGDYIYLPNNQTHQVFELLNGAIKIGSYSKKGAEVPYEIISPGDVFGNLNYLGGKFFFEYARALTSCTVSAYPLDYFKDLIVRDPDIAKWYQLNAIRRWCRMEGRLFVICAERMEERLEYLYNNLDFCVVDNEGHSMNVFGLLSASDIAHLLGMTRQTLAALLKRKKSSAGHPWLSGYPRF